jgi:hypothetical protein
MTLNLRSHLLFFAVAVSLVMCFSCKTAHAQDTLFVVHFSTGSAWDTTKAPNEQAGFAEHSANLKKLRSDGLILFGGRYEEFGMIILRDSTLESATRLLESDPGVSSGLFRYRIAPIRVFYPWKD